MEHTDTQANTSNRWWRTTNIIKCGNGNTDKSRQQPKKRDSRATKNTDSVRRNRRDICRFSGVNIFQSINVSRRLVCLIFFFSKGVTWIKNKHTNASEMLFIVGSPISITKKKKNFHSFHFVWTEACSLLRVYWWSGSLHTFSKSFGNNFGRTMTFLKWLDNWNFLWLISIYFLLKTTVTESSIIPYELFLGLTAHHQFSFLLCTKNWFLFILLNDW